MLDGFERLIDANKVHTPEECSLIEVLIFNEVSRSNPDANFFMAPPAVGNDIFSEMVSRDVDAVTMESIYFFSWEGHIH